MQKPISRARIALLFGLAIAVLMPCAAAAAWTETVLYAFKGGTDGVYPQSTLIMDAQGNLYGTTEWGGGYCGGHNCGTVFKVTPNGQETVLHAFDLKDGKWPTGGLVMDAAGNLYGTTSEGGAQNLGTVFKITPAGVYTILYSFQNFGDGYFPVGGLAADAAGNLYGTTDEGGTGTCDCGTVFKLTSQGVHTILYTFRGGHDGRSPASTPIFDLVGNLYGTTVSGGHLKCGGNGRGCGTVYRIARDGTETVLHGFRGRDGDDPQADLIADAAGSLYGAAQGGGGTGCGEIGCGTVFKIAPDGTETILSRFDRPNGPFTPVGIAADRKGRLFGTSSAGGSAGCGTVFKVVDRRNAKAIYSFTCGRDGWEPKAAPLVGKDGTLYGTTAGGGNGFGVVFALHK